MSKSPPQGGGLAGTRTDPPGAGALSQLRASKSPAQGSRLAGSRNDQGASAELSGLVTKKMPASVEAYDTWLREYMLVAQEIRDAKTSLNDVLATHVLAMVPSCLDSFRLTFTDEQRSQCELPELTALTDRIRIQLRSAGLSTSPSAMLATPSLCPV
ncbi:hypothetical protein MVLG_07329, partial [Microbotryum lychnidis-dioicae p1A1 Lamole]